MKIVPTKEQREYHNWLRIHGCVISRRPDSTIHHVHGGSMTAVMGIKGAAMRANHWLVIPLDIEYHSIGKHGVDSGMGVLTWERTFGTQLYWLAHIAEKARRIGIDPFQLAGVELPHIIPKYPEH